MTPVVSVAVTASDFGTHLKDLVASLDLQSLPTSAFEVVLIDLGSAADTVQRLRQLTRYRPNYTLVQPFVTSDGRPWLDHCGGDYVLRLRADQRLLPRALERLHAEAEQHQLDAVAARVSRRGSAVPDLYTADQELTDQHSVELALTGAAVLVRRSVLLEAGDLDDPRSLHPRRTGVLASYPALVQPAEPGPAQPGPTESGPAGGPITQDPPTCRWRENLLRVEAGGTVPAPGGRSAAIGDVRALVSVHHLESGLSHLLEPSEVTAQQVSAAPDDAPATWRWSVTFELDVTAVTAGTPLDPGLWELDLQLSGIEEHATAPVTVAWTSCPPAVIGATMVVPSPVPSATLQLDVGPTTWPLVRAVDPASGTITESAQGSLLDLPLPQLHLNRTEPVAGQIALDQLRLPAQIVMDGSLAHLRSFVSGWAGTPRLSAQFGAAPMRSTGADLAISGTGAMTLVKTKPAPKKAPPKKPPAKKAPSKKAAPAEAAPGEGPAVATRGAPVRPHRRPPAVAPVSRAQRLRRSVPRPLEPAVALVARNALARRLYRRAIGR